MPPKKRQSMKSDGGKQNEQNSDQISLLRTLAGSTLEGLLIIQNPDIYIHIHHIFKKKNWNREVLRPNLVDSSHEKKQIFCLDCLCSRVSVKNFPPIMDDIPDIKGVPHTVTQTNNPSY